MAQGFGLALSFCVTDNVNTGCRFAKNATQKDDSQIRFEP